MDHKPDYENPDVPHEANWATVHLADIQPNPDPRHGLAYFDVWCSICGQSGSFSVDVTGQEVAWV